MRLFLVFLAAVLLTSCQTAREPSSEPHATMEVEIATQTPDKEELESELPGELSEPLTGLESESQAEPEIEQPPATQSEAQKRLNEMTIEEKAGQMLFLAFRSGTDGLPVTEMTEDIANIMLEYKPGGVILFAENIVSEEQVKTLISSYKAISVTELFVGVDEEGGAVSRTAKLGYEKIPSALEIAKQGADAAKRYGGVIGGYLSGLGFTVDFAPVADINTNPKNTVIGSRAFGSSPETAALMVISFMKGLRGQGIHSAVKHFPGHGDTNEDSHNGFASVTHDIERLRSVELVPFKAAIDAGTKFVMVGHVSAPAVTGDYTPAIFSEKLVTGLLREEMGFSGIIITDAMDMGAVTKYYSAAEAAVLAVKAGIDMLLMPQDFKTAHAAIVEAAKSGELDVELIDRAVLRILELKYR